MTRLIKKEEFEKDGIIYIHEIYSNGSSVKYVKSEPISDYSNDILDDNTEAMLEMQTNVQYLVDLAEINMED